MSRWAVMRDAVRRLFHRHTPRGEKLVREQENFAVAAEAVAQLHKDKLEETVRQLQRIYAKEVELMRGQHHHVNR